MKRIYNIGLVAHVDAGKTTTAEQILYRAGAIKELGNVNKGSSRLDYHDIERQRGITVFSDQITLEWNDCIINLIDTPGHVDFSTELERAIKVLDCAILVISALEGVQAHTETIWNILRNNNIPTIIYVNKFDRVGIDIDKLQNDLETNLTDRLAYLHEVDVVGKEFSSISNIINSNSQLKEGLIERLAEHDERLLDKYLGEVSISNEEINTVIKQLIEKQEMFPVCYGAAAKGIGIEQLLDVVTGFMPSATREINQPFGGYIYKIKNDNNLGKLTFIKVISGSINVRDTLTINGEEEKVSGVRKCAGDKYIQIDNIEAGDIGILCGITNSKIGQYIGNTVDKNIDDSIVPVLRTRVIYDSDKQKEVIQLFRILDEEDPCLNFEWNNERKDINISVMGLIQMEVLKESIANRFGISIDLEQPKVNYMETISSESNGFCHFEPKKHFAEVEVRIEPLDRGQGIVYESHLSVDDLPSQFQNIIEKNIVDSVKHGVVLGAPVTDIKIMLIDGQHHLEHTHGGDFRIATIRAVQQALKKNKCQILEPLYTFRIVVSKELSGRVMTDILKMKGTFNEPEVFGEKMIITGEVPIATSINYPITLASLTSGKAVIGMRFSRYKDCHNTDEVIADEGNIRERDEKLYNSITILRHKKKMLKVTD